MKYSSALIQADVWFFPALCQLAFPGDPDANGAQTVSKITPADKKTETAANINWIQLTAEPKHIGHNAEFGVG